MRVNRRKEVRRAPVPKRVNKAVVVAMGMVQAQKEDLAW